MSILTETIVCGPKPKSFKSWNKLLINAGEVQHEVFGVFYPSFSRNNIVAIVLNTFATD